MITTKEIEHIANLSRLEFSAEQKENFKNELNQILTYVNELQKVDTSHQINSLNPVSAENDLRADKAEPSFSQEQATQNATHKKAGAFFVPIVME